MNTARFIVEPLNLSTVAGNGRAVTLQRFNAATVSVLAA